MKVHRSVVSQVVDLPRFRVVRGAEGLVRVDIRKAQEAMKHAMVVRKSCRANDDERNTLVRSHVAR